MTFNPVLDSGHDSASVGCADSPILAPPLPYISIYIYLYITGMSYREELLLHSVFKYYQFSFWPQIHQYPWIGLSFHGQSAPITDTS